MLELNLCMYVVCCILKVALVCYQLEPVPMVVDQPNYPENQDMFCLSKAGHFVCSWRGG